MGGSPNDPLPEGWDESVPETLWPDAVIACVRMDLEALASPRVIASLVEWREALRTSKDPGVRDQARRRLRAVCNVILGEEDLTMDQTVDAYDLVVERERAARRPVVSTPKRTPPPPPPRDASETGPVPDPSEVLAESPTTAMSLSAIEQAKLRNTQAKEKPKPRAALAQVRALHTAVIGFCEELVPLSYERRARRFWAHWREVSGDRGVRRELVEELLRSSTDAATLVSGLIAEVQGVDLESVRALVAKIEASGRTPKVDTSTRPPAVRPNAPVEVVGAPIDLGSKREP